MPGIRRPLLLFVLSILATPASVLGVQGVTERSPNLAAGWVGEPGTLHFHVAHRFWAVGSGDDDKLINSPTMTLAVPLPGRVLAGARYASNSLAAGGRANEWEGFLRWSPLDARPFGAALTLARNGAAGGVDGEIEGFARFTGPAQGLTLVGAIRHLGDAFGTGESGAFWAGGAVFRVGPNLSVAADVGGALDASADDARGPFARHDPIWGAGVQLRIPTTPHTLSIQATNTRTATLQGSSAPFRTTWGFEFTVPLTPARYLPRSSASSPTRDPAPAGQVVARVTMDEELRFVPDTLRVQVGTTVIWTNTSSMVHTVTAHPMRAPDSPRMRLPEGAEPFDSGILLPGEAFEVRFTIPGTYLYLCLPHEAAGMWGVVEVMP